MSSHRQWPPPQFLCNRLCSEAARLQQRGANKLKAGRSYARFAGERKGHMVALRQKRWWADEITLINQSAARRLLAEASIASWANLTRPQAYSQKQLPAVHISNRMP
jgi:hypothetical protein